MPASYAVFTARPALDRSVERGSKRICVLHLIYSPGYGGIESAVINWVRNFDRSRFDVHVAYFAGDRDRELPFLKAAKASGIDPIPVPWTRFKPFVRCAREVARIAKQLNADIIHTHAYYGDAVGAIAGKMAGVKTIATVYVWGKYELHRQLMQLMDWTAIQFMDRVTAHCADTQRKTFVIGKRRRDIEVLLPGYPSQAPPLAASERAEARRQAGIADDELLLVNAARLAPEKAQDQLLRIFKTVHERHPRTRLWITGVGLESVQQEILRLRAEFGLEQSVELTGFQSDYRRLLGMADMIVHPAHVEGMPLALLGAMEAGVPIVASAVGGVPELIVDNLTGRLIRENDESGFAKAVLDLIERPSHAAELGRNARNRVRNELSIETAVRKVERVYREMLGKADPSTGRIGVGETPETEEPGDERN